MLQAEPKSHQWMAPGHHSRVAWIRARALLIARQIGHLDHAWRSVGPCHKLVEAVQLDGPPVGRMDEAAFAT